MKIVLDTNVLIAAFIANGVCSDLFEHCVRHHCLITSDFNLNEFRDKLIQKFRFTPDEAGNCDCIITGDKDLLVLQRFQDIDIVSPSDFSRYEASC